MTWETFYDRFYDWENSTQISNISKLENFGPSAEVCEIALAFVDEKAATRLVKKALAAGVRFTADELDTISLSLSEQDLKAIARKSGLKLDEDNFVLPKPNEMDAQVDRMLEDVDVIEENLEKIDQASEHKTKKFGFGKALFLLLSALSRSNQKNGKKRNGRCDGDCANCPPHYGYRYGRWYYGRGHRYGCQRGGNGGASGRCYRD